MENYENLNQGHERLIEERLEAVQELDKVFEESHEEYAGSTLYGSLARGTSTPESDIDLNVFIDISKLPKDVQKIFSQESIETHKEIEPLGSNFYRIPQHRRGYMFGGEVYEHYKEMIANNLRSSLPNFLDGQMVQAAPRPISRDLIKQEVELIAENYRAFERFENEARTNITDASSKDEYVTRSLSLTSHPDNILLPPSVFYALFHKNIGNRVSCYRAELLDSLGEEGEMGEVIWTRIMKDLKDWEEGEDDTNKPEITAAYPKTLKEARKVYLPD